MTTKYLELVKQIKSLESENDLLKSRIKDLLAISEDHRKLNGELRQEVRLGKTHNRIVS
jgi:hypothetical protein